jgi:hypothetical protein
MRRPEDKSSGNFDPKWPSLFNVVFESLDLREIVMMGCQYTWEGLGDNPTFEKLDRVLVSMDWEIQFPLTSVEPRDRNISDHTPLVINTGASTHLAGNRPFKFERGWLVRDGFYDMVANFWQSESFGSTPLECWQFKIHRLRQHLSGWARRIARSYRKEKKTLLSLLDILIRRQRLTNCRINLK